ncbi:ISAs1 family transposase [Candidatus Woesearchaeota archaeon]|nr:ISAs1 family transposase [Candidatus Woesearchaeota archaeon]
MLSEENINFLDYFSTLEDHRIDRKKLYPMEEILLLTLCGVICGCEGWADLEEFGKQKLKFLRRYRPFEYGTPSDDTLRRFFRSLDPEGFKRCFIEWVKNLQKTRPDIVSIDGKRLRRSYDKANDKPAIHMVSAFVSNARLVLGQEKVTDKSNEITAIPKLLDLLDISGAIVTIDAMGCQTKIAKKITDKECDYVFGLKGNQGALREDVELFFQTHKQSGFKKLAHDYCCDIDKGHGRFESRSCRITEDIAWLDSLDKWAGLRSIIMIESVRELGDLVESETRYYISSLPANAVAAAQAIRSHWGVENCLHWVLDVTFREDDNRIRNGNAPENMAIMRHAVINMLQPHRSKKMTMKRLRKMAGWDDNVLERILLTKF